MAQENIADGDESLEQRGRKLQMRLAKLPEFKPEWPPEVQKSWFEALARLCAM